MFKDKDSINIPSLEKDAVLPSSSAERLTALWALSESTLGGILHAIKMPFRGMVISGAAVILISLIANFSSRKNQIIKSTLAVISAKAVISPHSPLTAYISVFSQGLLGRIYFSINKFRLIPTLLLGITVALLNSIQKIIVLTLIYGETLWETINAFIAYITEELLFTDFESSYDYSLILIGLYAGIHLIAGIYFGIVAYRLIISTEKKLADPDFLPPELTLTITDDARIKKKKRRWLKPSAIIVTVISAVILAISYFYPDTGRFDANAIIIMIARSVLIIFIWFYFIAPRVKRVIRKYLAGRKNKYSREVESVMKIIPALKAILSSVWKHSAKYRGIKRINYFMTTSLVYSLKIDHSGEKLYKK